MQLHDRICRANAGNVPPCDACILAAMSTFFLKITCKMWELSAAACAPSRGLLNYNFLIREHNAGGTFKSVKFFKF